METKIDADVRFPTETELGADTDLDEIEKIADFYRDLDHNDLQPLWTQNKQLMPLEPPARMTPYLWKRKPMVALAERAGELITINRGGDRRVLSLANPSLGGVPYATPTLWGAIQYLNPHESAPGHRHTPGAIRFVLEGTGTWTTVDGDAIDMEEGDLILTPPWHWHDHNNGGDKRMIWFDGLDLPFVKALDAIFFENYPVEELQPIKGHNQSEVGYGGRGTVPVGASTGQTQTPYSPLLAYRWADTDATLSAMSDATDDAAVRLEFVNPVNGNSVMPTLACEMHRITAGKRTEAARKVGTSVFVALHGSGSTVIDGIRHDWEPGDMFAVPSWAVVDHEAHEQADLFAISDAPILKALSLYREQVVGGAQQVTATFQAVQKSAQA